MPVQPVPRRSFQIVRHSAGTYQGQGCALCQAACELLISSSGQREYQAAVDTGNINEAVSIRLSRRLSAAESVPAARDHVGLK